MKTSIRMFFILFIGWVTIYSQTLLQDSLSLVKLYRQLNGPQWKYKDNWLQRRVNEWYGITVDKGRVTAILLANNNLEGTLPSEIGNLDKLRILNLSRNKIQGSIPPQIGNLAELEILWLNNNQLKDSIPSEIGLLKNLTSFNLSHNSLKKSLPPQISHLKKMSTLLVNDNQLTGSIPDSIILLDHLERLWVLQNQFVDLPDISVLPKLEDLRIEYNRFTFEDIEPNVKAASYFIYSPQDSVGIKKDTTIFTGESLQLSVQVGGKFNVYQWKKNGEVIPGATDSVYIILSAAEADSGVYSCEIRNTVATELILYSRPIRVNVQYRSIAPIYPVADSIQYAGDSFWLEVVVGSDSLPVKNLFGVSFALYEDSPLLEVVPPEKENILPGDFLGDSDEFLFFSLSDGDSVNVGITRKRGSGGVNGWGAVARVRFQSSPETPDSTVIHFSIRSIVAVDSAGNEIPLVSKDLSVLILRKPILPPFFPSVQSPQVAGDSFYVDIVVGSDSLPVQNLFGISFSLWEDSPYLEVVPPTAFSVRPGEFLGDSTEVLFFSMVEGDSVNVGITRRLGMPNVDGSGTIARILFRSDPNTPDSTIVHLMPRSLVAVDSVGNKINLIPLDTIVVILNKKPDFQLQISPPQQTIFPGDSAIYTISIIPVNNFSDTVQLSLQGLEQISGIRSYHIQPQQIAYPQIAELHISTLVNIPRGDYPFNIWGRTDSLARNAEGLLTIAQPIYGPRPNVITPNGDGYNEIMDFYYKETLTGEATILIFTITGEKIREIPNGRYWDGRDDAGSRVKPGVYLYVVQKGSRVIDKGMVGVIL